MSKIIKRIAAIITAVAIGGGLMAVTAPTADAASRGTVTRAEAKKVVNEAMRQKQLTKNEVRKIVHGKGKSKYFAGCADVYTLTYKGTKKSGIKTMTVYFLDNKTVSAVDVDYRKGKDVSVESWALTSLYYH